MLDYDSISSFYKSFFTNFSQEKEPIQENKWIKEMKSEINALEDNRTWIVTQLPKDKKAIGCR